MRKFLPLVLVLAAACAPQIGGQMPMQAGHAVGYYIKKFDRSAMSLAPVDRRVPNTEFVVANNNPTSAMVSTMLGALGPIVYAAAAQKSLAPEVEAHLSNPRIDLQAMMIKSLQTRAKSGVSVVAGEGDGRNAVILEPQCFLVTDDSGNGRLVTVVSANAY